MKSTHKAYTLCLAGSLSVMLLAGCPNAGSQPPVPTASGSGAPDGGSTSTSATASPSQPTNPTGSASPSAKPAAPQTSTGKSTLRGKVYDESGAVVDGATVRVRSLSAAAPFDSTVNVTGGAYVVNLVPTGVQVEITATKGGWTKRVRVESLLPDMQTDTNYVNFGGTTDDKQDARGAAYFISDYPEIANAAVADNKVTTGEHLAYKLTFSEPLDAKNQRRVQDGFRVSSSQTGYGEFTISDGSRFVDNDIVPKVEWNAEGTEMTFTFEAPLLTNTDDDKPYRVQVIRPDGVDPIQDKAGKVLGMSAAGGYRALKRSNLVVAAGDDTAQKRWDATHLTSTTFDVKKDETKPSLTGVSVSNGNRITLTFSEPMGAYLGDSIASNGIVDLSNFTFKAGKTAGDVDGETWDDAQAAAAAAKGTFKSVAVDEGVFRLTGPGVTAEIVKTDAKSIRLMAADQTDKFITDLKALKVRVGRNVKDPAGNAVNSTNDAHYKVGTF